MTLDSAGEVVDMVGDINMFAGEGEGEAEVAARLLDLLEGAGTHAEVLHAVELAPGRYADIHILAEGDLRHFVLLDASDVMLALQRTQQLGYEAVLQQERERRALRRPAEDRSGRPGAAFRRRTGLAR